MSSVYNKLFDDKLIISFNYRSQPVTIMLDQLIDFINGSGSDLVSAASPKSLSAMRSGILFIIRGNIRKGQEQEYVHDNKLHLMLKRAA